MTPEQVEQMHHYMPKAMQQIGMDFHREAGYLVEQLQDVAATGQPGPAMSALATVSSRCVACHAGFRFSEVPAP